MKPAPIFDSNVERHYGGSGRLTDAIRQRLIALGKDVHVLTPRDIESIDEFHIRGRAATLELAHRLNIRPEHRSSTSEAALAVRRARSLRSSIATSRASTSRKSFVKRRARCRAGWDCRIALLSFRATLPNWR
jgi:hypothetical protein